MLAVTVGVTVKPWVGPAGPGLGRPGRLTTWKVIIAYSASSMVAAAASLLASVALAGIGISGVMPPYHKLIGPLRTGEEDFRL